MKRTIIIIASVAILGALSYGLRQNSSTGGLVPASQTKAGASSASTNPSTTQSLSYKDGTFTGKAEDMPYGTVQVAVVISGGKISDIKYVQMPSGLGHTNQVTAASEPLLKQATIQAQSANIDFVSGATLTSESYQASLQSALDQAAVSGANSTSNRGSTSNNSSTNSSANSAGSGSSSSATSSGSPYPYGGEGE